MTGPRYREGDGVRDRFYPERAGVVVEAHIDGGGFASYVVDFGAGPEGPYEDATLEPAGLGRRGLVCGAKVPCFFCGGSGVFHARRCVGCRSRGSVLVESVGVGRPVVSGRGGAA